MKTQRNLLLFFFVVTLSLLGQTAPSFADKRVALVIGNGAYTHTPALINPPNDARDVAQALAAVGFDVTLKVDVEKRQMDQAIAQFAREGKTADAVLFYYAGHGMQFEGKNFLMPVDAELQDELSLRYEMTTLDDVKAALQLSRGVKIMVLDACRNNPLAESFDRSISRSTRDIPSVRGFAPPGNAQGMIIVYATQADAVANDGDARNSPFSQAFLKEIKEPGLEVGTMFRRIGADVFAATNGQQSPELSISMVPEYYLNQSETDQTIWARIRTRADVGTLREFLDRYPSSFYAPDARALLDLLEREAREKADREAEARQRQQQESEAARLQEEQARSEGAPATTAARVGELSAEKSALVTPIEAELRRIGCYTGADADWDAPSVRLGVAEYARFAKLVATPTLPDAALLDSLKSLRDRLCPLECSPRETAVNGRCVDKACSQGEVLSRDGHCSARPRATASVTRPAPSRPATSRQVEHAQTRAGSTGRCFNFNGAQYCE